MNCGALSDILHIAFNIKKYPPNFHCWESNIVFPWRWYCNINLAIQFSSVQFSHSVVSNSLPPHEFQHTRHPCPSPTPGVHSNSCPSSQWCHPAISSSVIPFSSCPQSFPASESFPMSQLFAWGGQSTGVSALANLKLIISYLEVDEPLNWQKRHSEFEWYLLPWCGKLAGVSHRPLRRWQGCKEFYW